MYFLHLGPGEVPGKHTLLDPIRAHAEEAHMISLSLPVNKDERR